MLINLNGDFNFVYEWMLEDEYIDLINLWNLVVIIDILFIYIVIVLDIIFGCVVMDIINIEVYLELNLMINLQDIILCVSGLVIFMVNIDFLLISVVWFVLLGDIFIGIGMSVIYQLLVGILQVYVVVMSGDGCMECDIVDIFNYLFDVIIMDMFIICEFIVIVDLLVINNVIDQDIIVVWVLEGVLMDLDEFMVMVDLNVINIFSVIVIN